MCLCMCVSRSVYASGIKVGGLSALSGMSWGWMMWRDGGKISRFWWCFFFFFYGCCSCNASLSWSSKHIHTDEGLRATLSSCSGPSSHSYIVNEQKRERRNEKQHRSGFWRVGWNDIISFPKPQRAMCHWLDGNTNKVFLCPLRSRYSRRTLFETN